LSVKNIKKASGNGASTTLSSSVSDSATAAPLTSDTNFSAKAGEGMVIIGEETATPEFAYASGKSGSSLTIPLANRGLEGGSAVGHAAGETVKGIITAGMWNDFTDAYEVEHNDDGTHKTATVTTLKATSAEITTGTVDTKLVTPKGLKDAGIVAYSASLTNYSNLNAPEGFLVNGKIVPSVASNNLTVAIKGMDGNDPSASNPVYCRIGDTVRTITSALSVTKNAGTNWFNSGSAELATKEIDYFVYLGYNATDGVVVGFCRIPYATLYSEFSATTTNEKYCAISTITNAAAGDTYQNVGRFAATLSAGAGYTWTVPTFTSANLIQRPIYETRGLFYVPTMTGWSGTPTYEAQSYRIQGNTLELYVAINGTKTTGGDVLNLPFSLTAYRLVGGLLATYHNGTAGLGLNCTNNGAALNSTKITTYAGNALPTSGAYVISVVGKVPIA
jgi:hypothetical protein